MGWLLCWMSKVCCSVLQPERSNEIEAVSTGLSRDSADEVHRQIGYGGLLR